jgi:type I restriction enzyme M protein
MKDFQYKVNFIWSVANEILRDDFKRSKYPDVVLPFTVLRRVDCVLEPTKDRVLERYESLKGRLDNLHGPLVKAAVHLLEALLEVRFTYRTEHVVLRWIG